MALYAFLSAGAIALLSLVGALVFKKAHKTHTFTLPLAVGVFLGVVFFELLPETFEMSHTGGSLAVLGGFLGFYALSHFLGTFHHHHTNDHDSCLHHGARILLIGDAIHNIADGVVVASAFMINPVVGLITTVGIAFHEIPQEIAEFGILLRAGYTRARATTYNLLSASSIFVGVGATLLFSHTLENSMFILTGVAAGNLLYIATADLIPELRESHRDHFGKTFLATLLGVACIGGLVTYTHTKFSESSHTESEVRSQ